MRLNNVLDCTTSLSIDVSSKLNAYGKMTFVS